MISALIATLPVAADADILGARASGDASTSRLVLEMDSRASHHVFTLGSPDRVVIDIQDTDIRNVQEIRRLSTGLIKRIRTGVRNGDDARLVLEVSQPSKVSTFELPGQGASDRRLVVDLTSKGSRTVPKQVVKPTNRDVVVVIDPGHGGKDPGAHGPSGTQEKYVVLALAKLLAEKINAMPGYRAILTRTDDRYLKLRERTAIARRHGADLMISVHADAFKSPRPKGASVFALSKSGASSETARWLAKNENSADLIGGSGSLSLEDKDEKLASVLLDLSMTSTINTSIQIGDRVLSHLGAMTHLHKEQVEQAGFVVLKSPDIPSILVEAGFISNPDEERNLNSRWHRNKLADSIAKGVSEYFQKAPPPGTHLALRGKKGAKEYIVKPGDTLSGIASRHGVNLSALRSANNLSNDMLWVGQKVRIPSG